MTNTPSDILTWVQLGIDRRDQFVFLVIYTFKGITYIYWLHWSYACTINAQSKIKIKINITKKVTKACVGMLACGNRLSTKIVNTTEIYIFIYIEKMQL